MHSRHLFWTAAVLVWLQPGCHDESAPVDIPFDGVDVSADPLHAGGPPSASVTASAAPSTPVRRSRRLGKIKRPTGSITGCCSALNAKVKTAKGQGEAAMYGQATAVCYRKSKQVEAGELERAKALAQVRSSLLGSAPAACR